MAAGTARDEELATLQAIYGEEIVVVPPDDGESSARSCGDGGRGGEWSVAVHVPRQGGGVVAVSFELPEGYPDVAPVVGVEGLPREARDRVMMALAPVAASLVGGPSLFALVECVREHFGVEHGASASGGVVAPPVLAASPTAAPAAAAVAVTAPELASRDDDRREGRPGEVGASEVGRRPPPPTAMRIASGGTSDSGSGISRTSSCTTGGGGGTKADSGGTVVIASGEPFTVSKSTFQGHVARVRSAAQVAAVMSELLSDGHIARATHNIMAYRYVDEATGRLHADCDDDGEDAAGGRLAHLLELMRVENAMVVVSRWFGGVLLGPSRFKHINEAARAVVEAQPWYAGRDSGAGGGGAKARK